MFYRLTKKDLRRIKLERMGYDQDEINEMENTAGDEEYHRRKDEQ
ncbi:MAG: hypothetical protein WC373_00790 [Smithella sp.]|jgi:hypothetical protein